MELTRNNIIANLDIEPRSSAARAQANACGKTIVVGEHAVVYGATAIAMPLLGQRLSVDLLVEDFDGDSSKPETQFLLHEKTAPQHVSALWGEALSLLGLPEKQLTIHGRSNLPLGAGLGSSASLCVAAIRALSQAFSLKLSNDQIANYANHLEARFHGKPSGLDTAVVAHERLIKFNKKHPAQAFDARGTWNFAIIDSGIRAATLTMINLAAPYFSGHNGDTRLQRFESLSSEVENGLKESSLNRVAAAMNEAGEMLKAAGVVTKQLDDIITETRRIGVRAAKITGAGGGGSILALLENELIDEQLTILRTKFGTTQVHHINWGPL